MNQPCLGADLDIYGRCEAGEAATVEEAGAQDYIRPKGHADLSQICYMSSRQLQPEVKRFGLDSHGSGRIRSALIGF